MKIADCLKFVLTVALMGATIALAAFDPVNDDTDIFLANPNVTSERPNVLIVLDNTANWNQPFTNEKNALVQVVNGLTDAFNVGLMMFPETGGGNDSVDGGYVRYHVRRMTATNKTALASMVNNLDILADKGNNATTGLALYEAYLYYAGLASVASFGKVKTDTDGTTDPLLSPLAGAHALPASPSSSSLYRSPVTDGCARSFIIYISNGPANENAAARSYLEGKLATLTGVTPPAVISINPSGQQANWADEMAKFMANADVFATSAGVPNSSTVQNVYTYTVEVDPGTTGGGPDMTALLKSIASNGKGKYFGVTSNSSGVAIVDALTAIFNEVQAVNSVFASTTLPVSVNVRGTNLNQVYIGVFRPDSNKSPRWLGNLKMYNLALNSATGRVFLADATNGPPPATGLTAENSVTGFVSGSASSFWTTNSSFWGYRAPELNGVGGASDKPDGDLVEKGGAAQQLRIAFANGEASSPGRNLYTCTTGDVGGVAQDCQPSSGFQLSKTPFTTTNDAISAASLQLDTRFVSPLTGFATKALTALTDRRTATISNANPATTINISSLSNGAATRTISSLKTAVPKVVSSATGVASGTVTVTMVANSGITKVGNDWVVNVGTGLSGVTTSTVFTFNCTAVTGKGSAVTDFNNLSAAARTVKTIVTSPTQFIITNGPTNSPAPTCTAGTVNGPGVVNSTTAQVNLPGHGYTSGQAITIEGATPSQFNGTFNITVPTVSGAPDPNNFLYTMTTAAGAAGVASGYTAITASGDSATAYATHAAATAFVAGTTVNISGASDARYNGAKTVLASPAPTATTFAYNLASVTPANTASPVYAVQGGGTTVTATATAPHGLTDGDVVVIAGSDIQGYNGTWRIACPGGCIPLPPAPPALPAAPTQFTYNTATDNVAPTAAIATVLPANNSGTVTAALAGATISTVTATVTNHGFDTTTNNQVVIESTSTPADTVHPGTWTVTAVVDTNTFKYSTITALASPTGTFTARPPTAVSRAIATVTAHGYTSGQEVVISNAAPATYNGTKTVTRVVDANTFEYGMTAAPGINTANGVTASIKTTTARATSVNHGFANGSQVTVAGANPGAFNVTDATIAVVDANTFTYTIATPQGDATGTILAGQASGASLDRNLIINWVRGEDNAADENANSLSTDIRASVHGDVLHSRPAVINYNRFTGSDDDVFVYYGGNDGVFHAVRGGYATPPGDTSGFTPGQETWGFIPPEFFGSLKRMRNNSPQISSAFKKPYFMDGPIGVYTKDTNNNGKLGDVGDIVNLYITNRRGGRFLYALDVNIPLDPKFLWKITNASTGFSELGLTWSQPTVVTNLAGLTTPVLVFGAGYDEAVDDVDPATVTSVDSDGNVCLNVACTGSTKKTRSMGRGIYVVNALTGAPIWRALGVADGVSVAGMTTAIVPGMKYAIPSDITVIRNETGGSPNRAYVGDTGGNLWRIDFSGANLSTTTVTKLASIADQSTAAGRRKFLFPPDVVGQGDFDAVLIGSGDREHPFDTTVTNRFYMFKDFGKDAGAITGTTTTSTGTTTTTTCDPTITEAPIADTTNSCPPAANPSATPPVTGDIPGMSDLTSNCIQDAAACAAAGQVQADVMAKLSSDRGWYVTLASGEKVIGNAISIAGTTFFNTNQPSATAGGGACGSNLGIARQYQVGTADATATADLNAVGGLTGADRSLVHAGGGYLPSPVHVVVMLGGKPVEAIISGIQVSTPAGTTLSARMRKYWYKEVDPR